MILKVNNRKISFFNEVNVSLKYDSVLSTFSFVFQFNPDNEDHKAICRPCSYQACTIENEGELLLTGVILSQRFIDSATPNMVAISGYSKTGVLEDCQIPQSCYPLQSDNINLKQIAEKILKEFDIKLVVDPSVSSEVSKTYKNSSGGSTQSVKAYLSELAAQRNIILTHNAAGDLVMTSAKATQASVYDFEKGTKGIVYELTASGQKMHSSITVQKQHTKKVAGATEDFTNPLVKGNRPRVMHQTSGDDLNTKLAARNAVGDELSAVVLNIEIEGWTLPKTIVRPNNIITVVNKNIFLYQRSKWFIQEVNYIKNEKATTANLNCVMPEVYNGQTPKNIFES